MHSIRTSVRLSVCRVRAPNWKKKGFGNRGWCKSYAGGVNL